MGSAHTVRMRYAAGGELVQIVPLDGGNGFHRYFNQWRAGGGAGRGGGWGGVLGAGGVGRIKIKNPPRENWTGNFARPKGLEPPTF